MCAFFLRKMNAENTLHKTLSCQRVEKRNTNRQKNNKILGCDFSSSGLYILHWQPYKQSKRSEYTIRWKKEKEIKSAIFLCDNSLSMVVCDNFDGSCILERFCVELHFSVRFGFVLLLHKANRLASLASSHHNLHLNSSLKLLYFHIYNAI